MLEGICCCKFWQYRTDEKRILVLCSGGLVRCSGLDRRVRRLGKKGGVGFFLVFPGGISTHLCRSAGARISCAGEIVEMGPGPIRGSVRLAAPDPGAGQSPAARHHRVRCNRIAGSYCSKDRGVLWKQTGETQRTSMRKRRCRTSIMHTAGPTRYFPLRSTGQAVSPDISPGHPRMVCRCA
jgi:hypothetical protein